MGAFVDLKTALTALVAAAPPDATVPVRWIGELLASESNTVALQPSVADSLSVDLTVVQVATRFGKGPSTVRTWLARGELEGAYRLHGHEWRIPLAAVVALQRSQSAKHTQLSTTPKKSRHVADLGEWRKHTRTASLATVRQ